MKKTIIFYYKFPKFITRCIKQNIRMSNLVILKWEPFEHKPRFEKKPLLFLSEIGIFDIFFKNYAEKVLKIYKSIITENFKPLPLCPIIKWWPFKVFEKFCKSLLLIGNIVKGAFSGLR